MDNRKNIGIVGTCVAVIVAVVGISIVWAAYSSNLTIKGSARAEGAKWSVIFDNLSAATKVNSAGVTSTAKETSTPTIVGSTSIENFGISVQTPGDFVSYTFKIRNDGNFPAKIDSSFSMPTPTCVTDTSINNDTDVVKRDIINDISALPLSNNLNNIDAAKLAGENDSPPTVADGSTDSQKVCSNLIYTLTYTTGGASVSAGDTFAAGEEKEVILKLTYKDTMTSSDLPSSSVSISNLNITIPFVQQ